MLPRDSTSPSRYQSFFCLDSGRPMANFWYMTCATSDGVAIEWDKGDAGMAAFRKWLFTLGLPFSATICTFRDLLYDLFYNNFCRAEFYFSTDHTFPNHFHFSATDTALFFWRNDVFLDFFRKTSQHLCTDTRLTCGTFIWFYCNFWFWQVQLFSSSWTDSNNDNCPSTCLLTSVDGPNIFFLAWSSACKSFRSVPGLKPSGTYIFIPWE